MCTHSVSHRGAQRRALAKARAVRAVELAAAGKTYAAIADVLGYADRGTVHRIVRKELEARSAESVDLLRAVEVARLDALQRGLWDAAMAGDPASCAAVVRIIDQRVRLLGSWVRPWPGPGRARRRMSPRGPSSRCLTTPELPEGQRLFGHT